MVHSICDRKIEEVLGIIDYNCRLHEIDIEFNAAAAIHQGDGEILSLDKKDAS
jgi:hypothetical protein